MDEIKQDVTGRVEGQVERITPPIEPDESYSWNRSETDKLVNKRVRVVESVVEDKRQIPILVVQHDNAVALVEWREPGTNVVRRSILPREEASEDSLTLSELESGIPYGVDWTLHLKPRATPQGLSDALHAHNIWLPDDALAKPQEALSAIMSAYGVDLQTLLGIALELKRKQSPAAPNL